MARYTQLNLNQKPQDKPGADRPQRKSNQRTTMFLGLLGGTVISGIILLNLGACSRKSDQLASGSSNQNPQASSSPAATAPSAASTPPAAVQPPMPKKVVKKRPSTVTYKDPTYGISFRYPRKYTLKTGDNAKPDLAGLGPLPTNFILPGAVTVATVELPKGSYPETDFAGAFFNVSVHRGLTTAECGQFSAPVPAESERILLSQVDIGEMTFTQVEDPTNQADARYYHVFENGACYEMALGLGTLGDSKEGTAPVDREDVFRRLDKILATVKINAEPAPVVAAAPAPSPESGKP